MNTLFLNYICLYGHKKCYICAKCDSCIYYVPRTSKYFKCMRDILQGFYTP